MPATSKTEIEFQEDIESIKRNTITFMSFDNYWEPGIFPVNGGPMQRGLRNFKYFPLNWINILCDALKKNTSVQNFDMPDVIDFHLEEMKSIRDMLKVNNTISEIGFYYGDHGGSEGNNIKKEIKELLSINSKIQQELRYGEISKIYKNVTTLLKQKNSDSQIDVPSMTTLSLHKFLNDVYQNNRVIERKKVDGAVLYQAIDKKPNQHRNNTTVIPQDFYPYLSFYLKLKDYEHGFKKEVLRIFSYILLVLNTKSF